MNLGLNSHPMTCTHYYPCVATKDSTTVTTTEDATTCHPTTATTATSMSPTASTTEFTGSDKVTRDSVAGADTKMKIRKCSSQFPQVIPSATAKITKALICIVVSQEYFLVH